jgi:hypothetical protein
VIATSLAGQGKYTDFHYFTIVEPEKVYPIGWILFGVLFIVFLIFGASISFYYKHKILTFVRSRNDRLFLMNEIEPTDFCEVSLRMRSLDRLSDSSEQD